MMKRILSAFAAVMLAAACSAPALEEIQRPEEPEKPAVSEKATIPFSLTVTTESTRVSYADGATYQFKAGDKIHVQGKTRTDLEGYLTQNGEDWSGDLSYDGDKPAVDTPLAITLVHADNTDVSTYAKAIVGSAPEGSSLLREAVEHYSLFTADNVTLESNSAVLYQQATFLDVTVEFDFDGSHIIDAGKALVDLKTTQGEVTEETDFYEKPNTNGEDFYVHFMAVIPGNQKVKDFSLTVGDRPITFTDTDKDLPRNKRFTVNRTIAFEPKVGDPFWSDGTYGRLRHPDSEEHIVGIVVYVNKGGDIADAITEKRTEANGNQLFGHGLVMALTNAAVDVKWSEAEGKIKCTGGYITKPEQTLFSTNLSGYSNTESIITALTNEGVASGSAASLAKDYTYNGFSVSTTSTTGWFLPSIGQWMYTISEDGFGGADPASKWTNGNGVRWLESPEYPLSGDLGDLIYVKECTDSKLNVLVSSLNDRLAQFQAEFDVTYDPFGDPTPTNNVSDNYWTSSEKDKDNALRMNLGSVKQRSGKYYSTIKVKGEEKTKVTVYTEGGVNYKMKVRPFLAF